MQYRTVRGAASAEFVEKRSRFIGYISPASTQEEAAQFIDSIRSKHWDATHNVPAYILREGNICRFSDDGEPQGTAGMPALNVLQKEGLTDCALVVTRYFGGILLGGGGLVRAYSHAAKLAVDAGGIVTRALCSLVRVRCDYNFYGRLASLIPEQGGIIENTAFEDAVTVDFRIPQELEPGFEKKLIDLSNGTCRGEVTGNVFADID
ncbi:MAG: YigZ family protein [Acutalibacteraceae bacterium]